MAIGDPYISRDELKDILGITNSDEDTLVDRAVKGASRAIERRSGWPTFWKTVGPETRSIDVTRRIVPVRSGGWAYNKVLLRSGIASDLGFAVSGHSTPILMPEDCFEDGLPADAIRLAYTSSFSHGRLIVTAQWGWPEVPDDIIVATQMQAHRFYNRKSSPEGVAGSAEFGLSRIPPLDPDVLSILKGGGFMRAGIG